jgi:DNA-binding NarL/FixJ family response regulator
MTPAVSVLLVEDHELLAQTLQVAMASAGVSTEVVAPTSAQTVLTVVEQVRPSLVLLDLELGEPVGDGGVLVRPMVELGSAVLVVTGVTDLARVAAAVEAGAVGYVAKSLPFDRLLEVVRESLAGRPVMAEAERLELLALLRRRRAEETQLRAPFDRLTPREKQVLRAIAEGHNVEAIAERWVVSRSTVRTQVRGILTKLDVSTQIAAVARARQAGWLDAE